METTLHYRGKPVTTRPGSIAEAEREQAELLDAMKGIDADLGAGQVIRNGQVLRGRAYQDWRHRALTSKRAIEARYRFVKGWLADQRGMARRSPDESPAERLFETARHVAGMERREKALAGIAQAAHEHARYQRPDTMMALVSTVHDRATDAGLEALT